jgi:transposase
MAKTNKRSNEDKKALALELFLETDKSQKEIADIVDITEKTLSVWKQSGAWDMIKQAQTITPKNIITNLYEKAYELSCAEKIDADKLIKLANTIEKLQNRKVTISHIINVFKDFTSWAFSENAELAKQINLLQKKYVDYKINGE